MKLLWNLIVISSLSLSMIFILVSVKRQGFIKGCVANHMETYMDIDKEQATTWCKHLQSVTK